MKGSFLGEGDLEQGFPNLAAHGASRRVGSKCRFQGYAPNTRNPKLRRQGPGTCMLTSSAEESRAIRKQSCNGALSAQPARGQTAGDEDVPREPRLPTHLISRRVLSANAQPILGALAPSQAQGLWGSSLVSIIGGFSTFNPKMLSTWVASKHPRESQLPALRETQPRLGGHRRD